MSNSSTAISECTNVKVNESDVINSGGRDTSHMTYTVQNSYNIGENLALGLCSGSLRISTVFPMLSAFFNNLPRGFRAEVRYPSCKTDLTSIHPGRDPVEINNTVPLQIPSESLIHW
ncbi:hypothetical protein M378DRAFT_734206 [Amanita muscaria Koide BX008]|uniref:Uncharacterized protein n=1 Tax=Amanita muscaria (strain Koide BX008) TaxID=946122 RepID=A0A0C2W0U5_AMAMK|nr:hypothetical protein M378DRAFT_734206 [Amanita muscaria Koide BX008]